MTEQINIYKIGKSPEELQKALMDLRSEYDAHIHDGVSSKTFRTIEADTTSTRVFLIRKRSFADTVSGIWMGLLNNVMSFNLGNLTNYLKWNGTSLDIAGNLSAGSINIPDATTPLFSVDASGNVVARSLKRKDYHWFTLFESLDGYGKNLAGTGAMTIGSVGVQSVTGTTSGNNNELQKLNYTPTSLAFTWDKSKACKYSIGFQDPVANTVAKIGMGSLQSLTDRHIGFKFTDGVVYGTVANGTTETELNLNTTLSNNQFYLLEFKLTAGNGVEFFINGVSKGTITTNLPTGTTTIQCVLNWHLQTTTAAAREMWLSFVDLWQAN